MNSGNIGAFSGVAVTTFGTDFTLITATSTCAIASTPGQAVGWHEDPASVRARRPCASPDKFFHARRAQERKVPAQFRDLFLAHCLLFWGFRAAVFCIPELRLPFETIRL
jgi:hypothetical protein